MIYLDNAATTFPKPECVYQACDHFARTGAVNAGRGAYQAARDATAMIRRVKEQLISLVDARDQAEVALTPSVTVALNQIIAGQAWREGDVAYVSPYEHNAVLRPLELVRRRLGVRVEELPLAPDLSIDLEACERVFRELPPRMVCVSAVSNVTGYVLPAREVFSLAKKHGAFTLLDAAQAMGHVRMRFGQLRADAVTFAGHKTLYAPFGVAGFLLRNGCDLEELLAGGNGIRSEDPTMPRTMPEKMECGSADTVAIAGLEASLAWLRGVDTWQMEQEHMAYLLPRLARVPGLTLYAAPGVAKAMGVAGASKGAVGFADTAEGESRGGGLAGEGSLTRGEPGDACPTAGALASSGPFARQSGVVSFNLEGFRANEVAAILDKEHGIAVRAGHHCAGRIHRHLHDKVHDGTVRVSPGAFTTREELDALVAALRSIDREMLKGISASVLRGNC